MNDDGSGCLRVLRELAHRGTLAAVADALSYSPSTISQQLSQLERDTGTVLLEPDGRRVRLTPQAHVLVAHTERALRVLDEAEAAMAATQRGLHGDLRVAAFQTAASALMPAVVEQLNETEPALKVSVAQMEPERAMPALQARDFDLVLTEDYPGDPSPRAAGVDTAHLLNDPLQLYPPTGSTARTLTDLARAVWVMEPEGTAARRWSVSLCRIAGFEPDVRFESTDLRFHADLVRRGQAAALLPDMTGAESTRDLQVEPLPGAPTRSISTVARHGHRDHPAIVLLRQSLAGLVAEGAPR